VFIDLREGENADPKAKRMLSDTIKADSPMVIRTAVVYSDFKVGVRAKIVYKMGKRENVEFFTDVNKAMAWLKS
jgi:hypothetical protein